MNAAVRALSRLAFPALLVLSGCAAWAAPGASDTLRTVPKPVASKELEAFEPELKTVFASAFPEKKLLDIYPGERDWRPVRHPNTGVMLLREAEFMIGYQDGPKCFYGVFRAFQEPMGSAWTKVDLGYPQGNAGNRYLTKTVTCASLEAGGKK